jgi:hypothetical protein
MGDQVQEISGPSNTQEAQGGQKEKEGQFGNRGLYSASKIPLSRFQAQSDLKTSEDSLTSRIPTALEQADLNPVDPDSETASNPGLEHSRQILKGGMGRALFGKTDNIGDEDWKSVHLK